MVCSATTVKRTFNCNRIFMSDTTHVYRSVSSGHIKAGQTQHNLDTKLQIVPSQKTVVSSSRTVYIIMEPANKWFSNRWPRTTAL